jgi:hypothetical protein
MGLTLGLTLSTSFAERLSKCRIFIAVIGPKWFSLRKGLLRRVFRPDDFVRLELVAALSRDILVIPALIEAATMPSAQSLPPSIAKLPERNAVSLSTNQFSRDVKALGDMIEKTLEAQPAALDNQAERAHIATVMRADIGDAQEIAVGTTRCRWFAGRTQCYPGRSVGEGIVRQSPN